MSERTPGDWKLSMTPAGWKITGSNFPIATVNNQIDADAIVLAVNSHEALVSALREVLMTTVNGHPVWESIAPTVAIKAKAALKKAEEL